MTKKDYITLAKLISKHRTSANLRRGITFVIKKGEFMMFVCLRLYIIIYPPRVLAHN